MVRQSRDGSEGVRDLPRHVESWRPTSSSSQLHVGFIRFDLVWRRADEISRPPCASLLHARARSTIGTSCLRTAASLGRVLRRVRPLCSMGIFMTEDLLRGLTHLHLRRPHHRCRRRWTSCGDRSREQRRVGGLICKSLLGKAHTVMAEGGMAPPWPTTTTATAGRCICRHHAGVSTSTTGAWRNCTQGGTRRVRELEGGARYSIGRRTAGSTSATRRSSLPTPGTRGRPYGLELIARSRTTPFTWA